MHESLSETSTLIRTSFCCGTDGSLHQVGALCMRVSERIGCTFIVVVTHVWIYIGYSVFLAGFLETA
jgi:hypothetical protein